jgi:hypothetical protein
MVAIVPFVSIVVKCFDYDLGFVFGSTCPRSYCDIMP